MAFRRMEYGEPIGFGEVWTPTATSAGAATSSSAASHSWDPPAAQTAPARQTTSAAQTAQVPEKEKTAQVPGTKRRRKRKTTDELIEENKRESIKNGVAPMDIKRVGVFIQAMPEEDEKAPPRAKAAAKPR